MRQRTTFLVLGGGAALAIALLASRSQASAAQRPSPVPGPAPPADPLGWIPFAAYRLPVAQRITIATAVAAVEAMRLVRIGQRGMGPEQGARLMAYPGMAQVGPWWTADYLSEIATIIGPIAGTPSPAMIDDHGRVEAALAIGASAQHAAAYLPPQSVVDALLRALPTPEARAAAATRGRELAQEQLAV